MNAGMDDLYREVILDHHRSPRCSEPLDHPDAEAAGKNPSCGDEVTLQLAFDGERITAPAVPFWVNCWPAAPNRRPACWPKPFA